MDGVRFAAFAVLSRVRDDTVVDGFFDDFAFFAERIQKSLRLRYVSSLRYFVG